MWLLKNIIKTVLITLFSLSLCYTSSGQITIDWEKCYGGSKYEEANRILPTADGGYVIGSMSYSSDGDLSGNNGLSDAWITKINNNGSILWQRNYGTAHQEYMRDMIATSDGGYIFITQVTDKSGDVTAPINGYSDAWIVKIDTSGNIQWQQCFGGNDADHPYGIIELSTGSYIITGYSTSTDFATATYHGGLDFWLTKLDIHGNSDWNKLYGGTGTEYGIDLCQTQDGNIVATGYTGSNDHDITGNHGYDDIVVFKTDTLGNLIWKKLLGGSDFDRASSILSTPDGGVLITGFTMSTDGDISGSNGRSEGWLVKLDISGNIQWQKCIGGANYDRSISTIATLDGNYIVTGASQININDVSGNEVVTDMRISKISNNGTLIWEKTLGGTDIELGSAIVETSMGNFIVAGQARSNNGDVGYNHGDSDSWLVKFTENTTGIGGPTMGKKITISPNPSQTIVNFSANTHVQLYNTSGALVIKAHNISKIDIQQLPSGIYYLKLENGITGDITWEKLIKQ